MEKAVYSIKEVATKLAIGKSKAYKLAHAGEIPVLNLGKRIVVPIEAFDKMLAEVSYKGKKVS